MKEEVISQDTEPPGLEQRLEGKSWIKRQFIMAGEGCKIWKFGSKEWAIWHTSSWITLTQVAFLGATWKWLVGNWALIVIPTLKKLALGIKALCMAVFVTGTP